LAYFALRIGWKGGLSRQWRVSAPVSSVIDWVVAFAAQGAD
jgi:hypothetical protein